LPIVTVDRNTVSLDCKLRPLLDCWRHRRAEVVVGLGYRQNVFGYT